MRLLRSLGPPKPLPPLPNLAHSRSLPAPARARSPLDRIRTHPPARPLARSPSQVAPVDRRFRAVNALRLIGYALADAGFPCTQLWDPANPLAASYGAYDERVCAALP